MKTSIIVFIVLATAMVVCWAAPLEEVENEPIQSRIQRETQGMEKLIQLAKNPKETLKKQFTDFTI